MKIMSNFCIKLPRRSVDHESPSMKRPNLLTSSFSGSWREQQEFPAEGSWSAYLEKGSQEIRVGGHLRVL